MRLLPGDGPEAMVLVATLPHLGAQAGPKEPRIRRTVQPGGVGRLPKAGIAMSECMVCRGNHLRGEPIDKVFNASGRYVLVTGMPGLRRAVFQP